MEPDGQPVISHAILAIAALAWVLLGVRLGCRVLLRPELKCSEARSPAALTVSSGQLSWGPG